jgi:3-oxoacyl-[acyl-carrier-protein] synthase-3
MTQPTLHQSVGTPFTRIISVGAARGDLTVPNDDIVGPIESSDEWIRQRTGVITRKRASASISAADLATDAAKEAISKAGIKPTEIGAVIIATISNEVQTPSMAALVADRIGATPAAAYDVSAACAGFCYAIAQADALVRAGTAKYVLVVGAE